MKRVLELVDGQRTVEEIAESLDAEFPPSAYEEDSVVFVRRLLGDDALHDDRLVVD